MSGLDQIVPHLSKLTSEELANLRSRVNSLSSLTPIAEISPNANRNSDDVLEVICDYLVSAGIEHVAKHMLRKSPQYKAFNAKCDDVIKFLQVKTRVEQRALLYIGIDLLYKNLVDMGIAVSARTLMAHIHRLPACMNKAFPMYSQNAMLHFILRKGK